jgi:hypothetical protein
LLHVGEQFEEKQLLPPKQGEESSLVQHFPVLLNPRKRFLHAELMLNHFFQPTDGKEDDSETFFEMEMLDSELCLTAHHLVYVLSGPPLSANEIIDSVIVGRGVNAHSSSAWLGTLVFSWGCLALFHGEPDHSPHTVDH